MCRDVFQRIEVSFLPVGHTHEDIDQMFSRTAQHLKNIDIPTRFAFEKELQKCYKAPDVHEATHVEHLDRIIDWSQWVKTHDLLYKLPAIASDETLQLQHFKFEKDVMQTVRVMFKSRYQQRDWSTWGFETQGHAMMPAHMPWELPMIDESHRFRTLDQLPPELQRRIRDMPVINCTPKELPSDPSSQAYKEHERLIRSLQAGIRDCCVNQELLKDEDKELLLLDVDKYNNREVEPVSEAWKQNGLFNNEISKLQNLARGLAADTGIVWPGKNWNSEWHS